jgi:hypothetical protein
MHKIRNASLLIALIIVLLLNACAPDPSSLSKSDDAFTNQVEENPAEAPTDPWEATGREEIIEKKDIIVSIVELQSGAYVSKVVLFLPDELFDSEVHVNGNQEKIIVAWEPADKSVTIHLFSLPEVSRAEITFKSGDLLLATCVIAVEGSISPSGDCGW